MRALSALTVAGLVMFCAFAASARPPYFDTFTSFYGFGDGDDLYACGVCHLKWSGTGQRNPYGSAVEQQLYLGKSVIDSLMSVEGDDSDLDGFTNVDEIVNFETLPGYSCDNFTDATGAPANYHTFITPMVASCLEPLDIRVSPGQLSLLTTVGSSESTDLEIFNNGTDFAISISSITLLDGTDPSLILIGPTPPFDIPVGSSEVLTVEFTPTVAGIVVDTIRISSNDPDESDLDVPISALGAILTLAPAEKRAACMRDVGRQYHRYIRRNAKEWSRCFAAELSGAMCDAGLRDLRLQKNEARLRSYVGGSRDRSCAAENLTPTSLGLPTTCGGSCDDIAVTNLGKYVDCLVCRQGDAVNDLLESSTGWRPPDLPGNPSSGAPLFCQKRVLDLMGSGLSKLQRKLNDCELANITAPVPVDCQTALAAVIAKVQDQVNSKIDRCSDTTGLLGCLASGADSSCLGDAVLAIGSALVEATFGVGE